MTAVEERPEEGGSPLTSSPKDRYEMGAIFNFFFKYVRVCVALHLSTRVSNPISEENDDDRSSVRPVHYSAKKREGFLLLFLIKRLFDM